jgi:hypothetical protein
MTNPGKSVATRRPCSRLLGGVLAAAVLLAVEGCANSDQLREVSRQPARPVASDESVGGSDGAGGSLGATGGDSSRDPQSAGAAGAVAAGGTGPDVAAGGGSGGVPPEFGLLGAPLPFAPTTHGFGLNVVEAHGNAPALRARIRQQGTTSWGTTAPPEVRGSEVAQWAFEGLLPGAHYEYEIIGAGANQDTLLYSGNVVTQRPAGEPFTFALISDSHIGSDLTYTNQGLPGTLQAVSSAVGAAAPDFLVNLGDMLDFHQYGFNDPPPSSASRQAYLNYRTLLGDTLGHAAHYATIGNWEGEDGFYTAEEIASSREQRLLYMPGPKPATYPEAGSPNEDYYAFTWGDALFVVLNVMSYTQTAHLLGYNPGLPDDWTLGEAQLGWLTDTLARATSKWRFLLIHHTVGGAAGNADNSAYGRGGGQAAYVGEQAKVHQLMLQHGVQIFFYGHDHVFTDMVVDGIHYTLPSSAGAPWLFTQSETGYQQAWLASGWAKVAVSPGSVDVQFWSMTGEILYEYALH